ncbi:unnamed protein product [Owenia fusiformis]|uniref:Uncharacterized protein n=1 Tax=Owenia fusiformis TaxID=6347 RepID=A0A8J1XH54_OWEFU|nr:unnamed protein product [Owenia fusiformis]
MIKGCIRALFTKSALVGVSKDRFTRLLLQRMSLCAFGRDLIPYDPPDYACHLKHLPKYKIKLAQSPTPIHKWNIPGVPDEYTISIKRDDMTGSTLSGNKVRKLEFLFADALERGCSHVITCGGIQSNHCRATAVAATQLGLKVHLVLRADIKDVSEVSCQGNLLMNRLCGADMYFVPRGAPYETQLKPRMEIIAQQIKKDTGEDTYHIPVGGSNTLGMFGYLDAFTELLSQGVADNFDDIVFACGSGGTAAGLCIANYLTGSKLKIHALIVCDSAQYYHGHINEVLRDVGLNDVTSEEIVDVIEGHKGQGYAVSQQFELDYLRDVAVGTGIMLDPVYTGKAVLGLTQELRTNTSRFKGQRILYIHTGGVFGLYDGRIDNTLKQTDSVTNKLHMWMDINSPPSDSK